MLALIFAFALVVADRLESVVGVSSRSGSCPWACRWVCAERVVVCWDADGRTLRQPPNLIFWAPVPSTASLSTAGVAAQAQ